MVIIVTEAREAKSEQGVLHVFAVLAGEKLD